MPFSFAFQENMKIIRHGMNLPYLIPGAPAEKGIAATKTLCGALVSEIFRIRRPFIELKWTDVFCNS